MEENTRLLHLVRENARETRQNSLNPLNLIGELHFRKNQEPLKELTIDKTTDQPEDNLFDDAKSPFDKKIYSNWGNPDKSNADYSEILGKDYASGDSTYYKDIKKETFLTEAGFNVINSRPDSVKGSSREIIITKDQSNREFNLITKNEEGDPNSKKQSDGKIKKSENSRTCDQCNFVQGFSLLDKIVAKRKLRYQFRMYNGLKTEPHNSGYQKNTIFDNVQTTFIPSKLCLYVIPILNLKVLQSIYIRYFGI